MEDPTWVNGVGQCFLRMRMAMEAVKPLVAEFWVLREGNSKVWVEVKYGNISVLRPDLKVEHVAIVACS